MTAAYSIHRILLRSALSAGYYFSWVILFQLELLRVVGIREALAETLIIFILSQIVTALTTPLAGKLYGNGMVRSMLIANIAIAGAFAFLGAASAGAFEPLGLACFGVLVGLHRAFYTVPAALMNADLSVSRSLVETVIACIPFVAGIVFDAGYVMWVLWAAAALALASCVPLLRFEAYEKFEWTYRETFGMLLESVHAPFVRQGILRGIEGAALFLVWPLFFFVMIEPSFLGLGLLASGSLLVMHALRAVSSRPIRDPAIAAALTGGVWIGRMSIAGPVAGIMVQVLGEAGRPDPAAHAAFDSLSDNGTFLDEVTALKEIALAFGRILLSFVLLMLLWSVSPFTAFGIAFVLAAAAAIGADYIGRSREKAL